MKYIKTLCLILFVFGFNLINAGSLKSSTTSSLNIDINLSSLSTYSGYQIETIFNNDGLLSNTTTQIGGIFNDVLYYDNDANIVLLLTFQNYYYSLYFYDINDSIFQLVSSVYSNASNYQYAQQRYIYDFDLKTAYLTVSFNNNGYQSEIGILELNFGTGKSDLIALNLDDATGSPYALPAYSPVNKTMFISYTSVSGQLNIATVDMSTKQIISKHQGISNIPDNMIFYMFTNSNGELFLVKPTQYSNTYITICSFDNQNSCNDVNNYDMKNQYQQYTFQPYITNSDNSILALVLYTPNQELQLELIQTTDMSNTNIVTIPKSNNIISAKSFRTYFNI